MIDIAKEQVLPLSKATKHVISRRRGRPTHVSTLYRWADRGLHGIQLEVIQVGNTLCTSLEALQRFFNALTAIKSTGALPSQDQAAAADDAAVDERLNEMGF